jgi:UDP-N-acetylglucosamine 2-epimerase (non-hydrolysing)
MQRVAVFMGTRPEAIKLAPVIAALRRSKHLTPVVVNTGQHRELIDQVIELFEIAVEHDLQIMEPNQTLASLTARLVTRIDEVLAQVQPAMILVQGDTTTVLAAALASFYRRVPVGHVEAGLRTGNLWSPFPEEANRKLATTLTTLHFAPTREAQANLLREHVPSDRIFVTGNTVIDALLAEVERQKSAGLRGTLNERLTQQIGAGFPERPFVLVTGHRRENFGQGFEQICAALLELATKFSDHLFIYPVHLNPNVQGVVRRTLGEVTNIRLIDPQPYREFVAMLDQCRMVLTDSGGVQEEGPSLGKPVLVMRDTTERPEGVAAGTVRLVGTDATTIVSEVSRLLTDEDAYRKMSEAMNPYGDGHAAGRIVAAIEEELLRAR